ncbi:MAG: hypothetical protein WC521_00495 [Bdellovibrionales bacterium]
MGVDPLNPYGDNSTDARSFFEYKSSSWPTFVPLKEGEEVESLWSQVKKITLRNAAKNGVLIAGTAYAGYTLKCYFACSAAVLLGGVVMTPLVASALAAGAAGIGGGALIKLALDQVTMSADQKKSQETKDLTLFDWKWLGIAGGKIVINNAFSGSKSRSIILGGSIGLIASAAGLVIRNCPTCVMPEQPVVIPQETTPVPTTEPTPAPTPRRADVAGRYYDALKPVVAQLMGCMTMGLTNAATGSSDSGGIIWKYFDIDETALSASQLKLATWLHDAGIVKQDAEYKVFSALWPVFAPLFHVTGAAPADISHVVPPPPPPIDPNCYKVDVAGRCIKLEIPDDCKKYICVGAEENCVREVRECALAAALTHG